MKNLQLVSEHHIIQLAAYAGRIVLTNGGEIYRVEEVVKSVGKKFHLNIDCFATLTCIIVSGKNTQGEFVSLVKRITSRNTDLDIIHQVNTVMNELENYDFQSLEKELKRIQSITAYPFKYNLFASALGAASFIASFNGHANDFAVAFISGAVVSIFSYLTSGLKLNIFFTNLIAGAICTLVSCLMFEVGFITNPSISIISTLMLLVPGVAFINSIRDIIAGDLVAGVSRAMEVMVIGAGIAIGAGIVLKLFLENGGF
nr:threonine/serine exporter family protein [uncultured Cetobacterium sp.]